MVGGGASFITHSRGCVSLERLTYCFSASQPAVHRAQYLQCTATRPISGTCVLTSKASTVLRKSLPAGLVERPLIGPARNAIATPCATPPGSCSFDVSFRGYRPRKRRGLNPRLISPTPAGPAGVNLRASARKCAVVPICRDCGAPSRPRRGAWALLRGRRDACPTNNEDATCRFTRAVGSGSSQ
jgi:hypothetical protein